MDIDRDELAEVTKIVRRLQERDGVCWPMGFLSEWWECDENSAIYDMFDRDDPNHLPWRCDQCLETAGELIKLALLG